MEQGTEQGKQELLFTDIKLVAGCDGTEVKMHRGVLAAASSVFRDIFASGATMREDGTLPMPGKTGEDLELLKQCMYVITPRFKIFAAANIERVLELAREFNMAAVTADVEEWLVISAETLVPLPRVRTQHLVMSMPDSVRSISFLLLGETFQLQHFSSHKSVLD